MKIKCRRADLMKAINTVNKAIPVKTPMTILECILIDATESVITFTANDLELGIETQTEGVIQEKGKVALNAKLFSEIIRKLPDSDVTICTDEENYQTMITCEKAKFSIMGRDGEEFSNLPYVEKDYTVTVSQFTLRELIRQTIFSIAEVETNKMMTGELLEIRDDVLYLISLDGHRISIRSTQLKEHSEDRKAIIPGNTMKELMRILNGGIEDMTNICITENHILFEFETTLVVSRLIEGKFFRIDQMVTTDYDTKIRINRKDFAEIIERSILLLRENDTQPIIENIQDSVMELQLNSQAGTMEDMIEIQMEGKDLRIGFNPRLLLDALKVIDDEMIDIYYMHSKAPCYIRDEAQSYIYLILPVSFVD